MSEVLSKFTCDYIPEGDSCGLVVTLIEQNAKLRELVQLLLHGIDNELSKAEELAWSHEVEVLMRELGVKHSNNG